MHLERSVSESSQRVERETRFTIFVNDSTELSDKLTDQIRSSLGAHAESSVKSQTVSRDQVMEHLKKEYQDLYNEIRDLGSEGESLIPRALHFVTEVAPESRAQVVGELHKIQGVESVQTSEGHSRILRSPVHGLLWLLRVLLIAVLSAWIVGWVSLARSQAAGFEAIHSPLRLWGASEFESRLPGILSGLWIGLPAAIVSCGAYWGLARPILLRLSSESVLFMSSGTTGLSICVGLGLMSLVAGAMVGWVSTGSR